MTMLVCTGILRNILEYSGIFWNIQEYSGIFMTMLVCTGIFWNIQDYSCSENGFGIRMPTLGGLFSSTFLFSCPL